MTILAFFIYLCKSFYLEAFSKVKSASLYSKQLLIHHYLYIKKSFVYQNEAFFMFLQIKTLTSFVLNFQNLMKAGRQ